MDSDTIIMKGVAVPPLKDLKGLKFHYWTVIERDKVNGNCGQVMWRCICDCGNSSSVIAGSLINGLSGISGGKIVDMILCKSGIAGGKE